MAFFLGDGSCAELSADLPLRECVGIGFHWVMMRRSVLDAVGADPFSLWGDYGWEDAAFCGRARKAGLRIFCDTTLPIAHIEPVSGKAFFPGFPEMISDGAQIRPPWNREGATFELDPNVKVARSYGAAIDGPNDQRLVPDTYRILDLIAEHRRAQTLKG